MMALAQPNRTGASRALPPCPEPWRVPGTRASIGPVVRVTGGSRWCGVLLVSVTGAGIVAPALLGSLAGDAEPHGDVGPAVAEFAQAGDGVAGGVLEVVGEGAMVGDGFDVAGGDAAAVGADDAAEESGVLVVLDDRCAVWCQGLLDTGCGSGQRGGHGGHRPVQSLHWPVERGMQ